MKSLLLQMVVGNIVCMNYILSFLVIGELLRLQLWVNEVLDFPLRMRSYFEVLGG